MQILVQYFSHNPGFFVGVVFLLGLMFGSFFNVVIYRVPIMMKLEWLDNARDFLQELFGRDLPEDWQKAPADLPSRPFNLVKPDSTCPKCGHQIRWYENVPLLSYVLLKGRCSACKTKISPRYPIIELVTGLLSAFIAWKLGVSWETGAILIFTWCLICLTVIDFDHKLLPDQITLPLMWLGILVNLNGMFATTESAIWGAVAGYLSLWSIYWIFKLLTGKEGMGYGDFKLLAALCAWMGIQMLPVIILLSSFVGAAVGITLILVQGRDKNIPIPFGPYLASAGWIALFWGHDLVHYYLRHFT